ncbi:MAG TPA: mechanosensitive ion channel domain-containing protein [Kofleriaceae bacterium]
MHSLTLWHGIMIVGALVASIIVGELASRATRFIVCRIVPKHGEVVTRVRGPVGLVAALALWQAVLVFLELPNEAREPLHDAGRVGLTLALVWLLLRSSDLAIDAIARRKGVLEGHELGRALLPIGRRVTKIVIVAIAIVAVLGSLGYSVTGLIAGLGIGGIAVALAAQKTLENVVGAFALGIDRPMREGDYIRVDQTIGTVERIGLRSTRVRTQDRTMIAIPNGKLADSIIERYTARDRYRFYLKLRMGLSTNSQQLRTIRSRIEQLLTDHAKRAADPVQVHFIGTGDTWFDLEAMAWYDLDNMEEFRRLRDELFLGCLDVIAEEKGTLSGASDATQVSLAVQAKPGTSGTTEGDGEQKQSENAPAKPATGSGTLRH